MSSINQILNNALENTLYETAEGDAALAAVEARQREQADYDKEMAGIDSSGIQFKSPSSKSSWDRGIERGADYLKRGKNWIANRPTWEKVAVPSAIGAGLGALILAKRLRAKKKAAAKK